MQEDFSSVNNEENKNNDSSLNVVGFILSLIGLLSSCCLGSYFAIIPLGLSIAGLVVSIKANKEESNGLSIAGIIIGIISIVLIVVGAIATVAFLSNQDSILDWISSMSDQYSSTM